MNQNQQFFVNQILPWFYANKRDLPFRKQRFPYHIWISEIMAQQTQIDTLIPYYERFIRLFPDIKTLAESDESVVLKAWEGLGYYSRAKNLHKAAKLIHEQHNDIFPSDYQTGLKLPGIGSYTGGAIYSIAFNRPVAAVDGNVLRVVCRYNNWPDDISLNETKKKVENWVLTTQPEDRPGDFNESLMELGALVCTPKNVQCRNCPLKEECAAYQNNTVEILPFKAKKMRQKICTMAVALVRHQKCYLLIRRPEKGLLAGLWGLPIVEYQNDPENTLNELLFTDDASKISPVYLGEKKHVFTHIIWEMKIYLYDLPDDFHLNTLKIVENAVFEPLTKIEEYYALPVAFFKVFATLKKEH